MRANSEDILRIEIQYRGSPAARTAVQTCKEGVRLYKRHDTAWKVFIEMVALPDLLSKLPALDDDLMLFAPGEMLPMPLRVGPCTGPREQGPIHTAQNDPTSLLPMPSKRRSDDRRRAATARYRR